MSVGLQQSRDELGTEDATNYIFKRFSEKFNITQGPIVQQVRDVGDDTIWGQFTWGESEWDNTYGSLFILGSATYGVLGQNTLGDEIGDLVVESVKNPNSVFVDKYDVTFFTDTDRTTADDSVVGEINFTSGEVYQSIEAYKGDVVMSKVTLNATIDNGLFNLYVWTDDNAPELVTNNVQHTLINSGTSIKYKAIESTAGWPTPWGTWGGSGTGTGKITNMRIEYI